MHCSCKKQLLKQIAMHLVQKLFICCFLCLIVGDIVLAGPKKHDKKVNSKKIVHKHKRIVAKVAETEPQVRIKNGATIIGKVNTTIDQNKTYYSFKRIPFAEPPVGDLRFRPPVPLSGDFSQQTIKAFDDGPACVQSMLIPTSVIGSEDCLYINVYTPQIPHENASLLPVMVWIYGGAFVVGDATYPSFGPDYLLNDEVMVVTFNYRVGIFGFLSTEDDASPGNYGLKDQLLALKWVQENIECFGGNPNQVTIFGESAGSVSVSYLTQTPLAKGLFHRAILESGTTLNLWGLTRHPKSIAIATAAALKVDLSSSQSLVDGLRKIDYKKLQTVEAITDYGQLLLNNPLNGLPFGPTEEVDHADAIVVNKSHEQLRSGSFHHVPYIIGLNSLESVPFVEVVNLIRVYLLKYDLLPTALVPASLNIDTQWIKDQVNLEIKLHYFGLTPVSISDEQLLKFISDDQFVRPILEAVRLYSQFSPVYFYKFSYQGPLGSGHRKMRGVGHAEELPYLWRIAANTETAISSDLLARKRIVRLWTNFAKSGNPTPTDDSLIQTVKWPLSNSTGAGNLTYLDIGTNLTSLVNSNWENFQFWLQLFNKYGNPPYSTF